MSFSQPWLVEENGHRAQVDGSTDQDAEGTLRERLRRLSNDAFGTTADEALALTVQDPAPHTAAYKVSVVTRAGTYHVYRNATCSSTGREGLTFPLAQVAFAIIACCLASGIIWGFAALKPVLIAEGVYRELCATDEQLHSHSNILRDADDRFEIPCAQQDIRLNLFFVSASTIANVSTLFAGASLDRLGRRACYVISSAFLAIGCILMGSAFAIPEFDGYLLGNLFLGLGGTFLFVPSFQLANAFPKHSGIVVALVTGAFDSSSAVFLFYRIAYDASGGRFSPPLFFFGYLIVPLLILVAEFIFMPSQAYHTPSELEKKIKKAQDPTRDVHVSDDEITSDRVLRRVRSHRAELRQAKLDQIEEVIGDADERQERVKLAEERQAVSGVWGALHGIPTHKQMLTPWFILILLLTACQMLRFNYFIATIRGQYSYMLDSEDAAETINHFFDVALPIGGVVSTPFIGLLLNKLSVTSTLAVLTVLIAILGTLNCLPYIWAGFATVITFVFFRPLYYAVMS